MNERTRTEAKANFAEKENSFSNARESESFKYIQSPAELINFLHKTYGNQMVERLLKSGVLQAKLKISQPNDVYEREADRVAEQVMRMPEPTIQRLPIRVTPLVQHQVAKEDNLQAKDIKGQSPATTPSIESRISELQGGGQPLNSATRAFFEPRFGQDFSRVRIHTDSKAAEVARAVNARAFTVGRDVIFGKGQYASDNEEKKRLLAHELTHVIQQSGHMPSIQKKNGSQNEPKENVKSIYLDYLYKQSKHWDEIRQGENIEERLRLFISKCDSRSEPYHEAIKYTKVANMEKFKEVYASFYSEIGDSLIKELTSDPERGVKIWVSILSRFSDKFSNEFFHQNLIIFRSKVDKKLIPTAYAAAKKNLAIKKSDGKTRGKFEEIASKQVLHIIDYHVNKFDHMAYVGVERWSMPTLSPDKWPYIYDIGGAIAGAMAAIVAYFFSAPILVAGLGITASGLTVIGDIEASKIEDENYRQIMLENKSKKQMQNDFHKMTDMLEKQAPYLALLYTLEAFKKNVNLDPRAPSDLESFIWQKLFNGDYSEYRERGIERVTEVVSKKMNPFFE